jgi:hypothetical protein
MSTALAEPFLLSCYSKVVLTSECGMSWSGYCRTAVVPAQVDWRQKLGRRVCQWKKLPGHDTLATERIRSVRETEETTSLGSSDTY